MTLAAADHAVATERVAACQSAAMAVRLWSADRETANTVAAIRASIIRVAGVAARSDRIAHRPREAGIGTFYPAVYGPYQSSPMLVRSDGPHGSRPAPLVPTRFGRKWLARINAAVNRRFPDPLPGILNEVYTPRGDAATLLRLRLWLQRLPRHREALRLDNDWRRFPARDRRQRPTSGTCRLHGRRRHVAAHPPNLGRRDPHESRDRAPVPSARCDDKVAPLPKARRPAAPGDAQQRKLDVPFSRPMLVPARGPAAHRALLATRRAAAVRAAGFAKVACHQEVLTKDAARSLGYWLHDRGH